MADVLRQPVGARQDEPAALAAGIDGAGPEFLAAVGGSDEYRQKVVHYKRGLGVDGSELGPGNRALSGSED